MNDFTKPALGVCYYPEHWPEEKWEPDAARMAALGLTHVRIGEFAWSRLEPERDRYEFDWMARAIDILHAHGLKVVLGTPTATPPKWLVDSLPGMLPVGRDGGTREFGSRRHYCFSHEGYRSECARIVTRLAKRFGDHPAVRAWQIDNEYGCHDTTLSFSAAALAGFQAWLAQKYQSTSALNRAWGNVFWSMEYSAFEEIGFPAQTVTEANPAHWMDLRRYASEQVAAFNRRQVTIIRKYSPGRDILHNFMGRILDFDHFETGADLDVASWDSYPIGFLTDRSDRDETFRLQYMHAGDPDFQAFHHDLYRAVGRGRWWVMEQQPGPVNWARHNPDPREGMVRLWTWEAIAHGAEIVSYFRWRQAPFGQEQMHAGLLRPDDGAAPGLAQVAQVAAELKRIDLPPAPRSSDIAIVFDYPSAWAWQIQPQGEGFDYFALVYDFYRAARRLGADIDFVDARSHSDFDGYKLVVVPGLFSWPEGLRERLTGSKATILIGPRSGSKTANFQIPPQLPPQLAGIAVTRVETLPPGGGIQLADGEGHVVVWHEKVEAGSGWRNEIRSRDGWPLVSRNGNLHYLAGWPDPTAMDRVMRAVFERASIDCVTLPDGIGMRKGNGIVFAFNYGSEPFDLTGVLGKRRYRLGSALLEPAGVSIAEIGE